MRVFCLSDLSELAPYAEDWDRLTQEVPFRSWNWLTTWWRHYGGGPFGKRHEARLFVPCVFDSSDRLIGVAPWYTTRSVSAGRVLRPLGDGEVCTDYLSVLCRSGMEDRVGEALADHLVRQANANDPESWDLLQLSGIDAEDRAVDRLVAHLAQQGCTVDREDGMNCWRLDLPDRWDDLLKRLSRNHREQVRRIVRKMLDSERAVLHTVGNLGDLPQAVDRLVQLHQQRWQSLGKPGCFASEAFAGFHREVMPKMLSAGQLQLHWLTIDDRPVAAEYNLAAGGVIYNYQSGMDPEMLHTEPGRVATIAMLRRAIEQGYRGFDFLCGDEPYKARWRAEPRPSLLLRIVPHRIGSQLRHGLWKTSSHLKQLVKSGLRPLRARSS